MSKHYGVYYRCDRCGKERRGYHDYCGNACYPSGWDKFGKQHFCDECTDLYNLIVRAKKDDENKEST